MFQTTLPITNAPELDALGILTSTFPVIQSSSLVILHVEKARQLAQSWANTRWPEDTWDTDLHFTDGSARTLNWMLLVDALNFCFWSEKQLPRWRVKHGERWVDGYAALAAALSRAARNNIPIWNAAYLQSISEEDLRSILHPDDEPNIPEIPLFAQRLANAREVGAVLENSFAGEAVNLIHAANNDVVKLVQLVAEQFTSFHDTAVWRGSNIFFYKRAQIFAGDVITAFPDSPWGILTNANKLTAFADYKVPQILHRLGILSYKPQLEKILKRYTLIPAGSEEEIAIRAGTIWAVEILRRTIAETEPSISAVQIDHRLWNESQIPVPNDIPYHRTITMFY